MRKYTLIYGSNVDLTVPDHTADAILTLARSDDAPEYLKAIRKAAGDDSDRIVELACRANLRGKVQGFLKHMFSMAGIEAKATPLKIESFQHSACTPTEKLIDKDQA